MRHCWLWPLLISAVGAVAACDDEIDEGCYEGLEIGSTKQEAIDALVRKAVPDVLVKVDKSFSASRADMTDLPEILHQDGVCLNTGAGTFRFGFEADALSYRARPEEVDQLLPGIQVGMSRADFARIIEQALISDNTLKAFNCIPDIDWVKILNDPSAALEVLQRFNAWAYWEPNSYSHADLIFTDGRLSRIQYHWRPFEE